MPLTADASTRRYYRAQWTTPTAGQPASCVIMIREPWYESETPDFLAVARHLRVHRIRVPEVYGILPAAGLMCLEDFGDCTLADAWRAAVPPERIRWGQRALDALIPLRTTATQQYDAACPAFQLAFDVPKLLSELHHFRQHAIEGLWQHDLSDAERHVFEAACMPLCELLAAQPRYFCHRDYHGWNIMAQAGTVGILDFQDARMGPQPYDMVSLLTDRSTPDLLGEEVSATLVDNYLARFEAESGQRVDRDAFAMLFDLVAVQRCLKALGTFAAMHVVQQRSQYLPYMAPTLTFVQPLLRRYEVVRPLAVWLQRHTPT